MALWETLCRVLGPWSLDSARIFLSLVLILCVGLTLLLVLFGSKFLFKPVLILVLLTSTPYPLPAFTGAFGPTPKDRKQVSVGIR